MNDYDHNHYICKRLACPRCGIAGLPDVRYACDICEECHLELDIDMVYQIEELTL